METTYTQPKRSRIRAAIVVLVSVVVVGFVFRMTEAGSLTPVAAPANDSMPSLASISDALTSSSYDSSGVVPSRTGNVFQVTKCIIQKMAGSPCP